MQSAKLLKSSSFEEIEKVIKGGPWFLVQTITLDTTFRKDLLKRFELITRDPISTGWASNG